MKIIHASGKRKTAIARATLKDGKGIVKINKQPLAVYKPEIARMKIQEPLILAEAISNKVDISINVHGGGWNAQAEAARQAIAKALSQYQPSLKKVFLDYDRHLIIADIRRKEPYKPNVSKARAKRQSSKR